MVVHAFGNSTWEAEADRSMCLRPAAWSAKGVLGQPELHRKTSKNKTKMTLISKFCVSADLTYLK